MLQLHIKLSHSHSISSSLPTDASFQLCYFARFFAKYTRSGHRQKCISKPVLYTLANEQGRPSRHCRDCSSPKSLALHRVSNPLSAHSKPFGQRIAAMISRILACCSGFIVFYRRPTGTAAGTYAALASNSPQYSSAETSGRCRRNFMSSPLVVTKTLGG